MTGNDADPALDRHDLYERCVQSPADLVRLLAAIHGGRPRVLGEDFCGTAAVSRAWIDAVPGGWAIAVDHDPQVVARITPRPSLTVVAGDVIAATAPPAEHRADVIWVGNFSIGEWHTRVGLLRYLRHAAARLLAGGVLACDLYGGESACCTGTVDRTEPLPGGGAVTYTWEQRSVDPLTGRVVNAMHFRVEREGRPEVALRDAFTYDWRLWGLPELRDAMAEAGFATTEVYPRVPHAVDDDGAAHVLPITDPAELDESYDVIVVGSVVG